MNRQICWFNKLNGSKGDERKEKMGHVWETRGSPGVRPCQRQQKMEGWTPTERTTYTAPHSNCIIYRALSSHHNILPSLSIPSTAPGRQSQALVTWPGAKGASAEQCMLRNCRSLGSSSKKPWLCRLVPGSQPLSAFSLGWFKPNSESSSEVSMELPRLPTTNISWADSWECPIIVL